MTTGLHRERLDAVHRAVVETGARSVIDLGCGDGDLLLRLAAEPGIARILGLDLSAAALDRLRARLRGQPDGGPRIALRAASMLAPAPEMAGFDCAVLLETIEHLPPGSLSRLERAVFRVMRPGHVVITTPNAEFNPLLGVPAHRFRHPDHRFEWTRAEFHHWCDRVAAGTGYTVAVADIAGHHPVLGGASQMGVFARRDTGDPPGPSPA